MQLSRREALVALAVAPVAAKMAISGSKVGPFLGDLNPMTMHVYDGYGWVPIKEIIDRADSMQKVQKRVRP